MKLENETQLNELELERLRVYVGELEYALGLVRPLLRSFKNVTIPAASKALDEVNAALSKGGK